MCRIQIPQSKAQREYAVDFLGNADIDSGELHLNIRDNDVIIGLYVKVKHLVRKKAYELTLRCLSALVPLVRCARPALFAADRRLCRARQW
jgi:hypothetical protein